MLKKNLINVNVFLGVCGVYFKVYKGLFLPFICPFKRFAACYGV